MALLPYLHLWQPRAWQQTWRRRVAPTGVWRRVRVQVQASLPQLQRGQGQRPRVCLRSPVWVLALALGWPRVQARVWALRAWEGLALVLGAGRVQGAWRPQQVQAQV